MSAGRPGPLLKQLDASEVQQRVIRLPIHSPLFPEPDLLFDLWHEGRPWASKLRLEFCSCGQPPSPHRHCYLEGAELHAGLHWTVGAELRFELDGLGRICVTGDLEA